MIQYIENILRNTYFLFNAFFFLSLQVKIWFQNRRMKWRNSKERELLSSGGNRDSTIPSKENPNPDLSDLPDDHMMASEHAQMDYDVKHMSHDHSMGSADLERFTGGAEDLDFQTSHLDQYEDDNFSDSEDEEINVS